MADSPETLTAMEIDLLRANVFTVWQPMFDRLRAEVLASRTRIVALEAALRKYGIHGPECISYVPKVTRECKCGLASVLAGEAREKEATE